MRYPIISALFLLSMPALAQVTSPCMEKKESIEREIGYASQHHNQHRIEGLKKALVEVQDHCSDSELRAQHQQKITKQRHKVAERQQQLTEARAKGNADKINTRQKKLSEAESNLKQLEARND